MEHCPRCKGYDPDILPTDYEWFRPFVGWVYSPLCILCRKELGASPNKAITHRSRKGHTYRWHNSKVIYTQTQHIPRGYRLGKYINVWDIAMKGVSTSRAPVYIDPHMFED